MHEKIYKGTFEIIIAIKKLNRTTIRIINESVRDHHCDSISLAKPKIT
jgi:hypothetical protein